MIDTTALSAEFVSWLHAGEVQLVDEFDAVEAVTEFLTDMHPEYGADDTAADLVATLAHLWWQSVQTDPSPLDEPARR